MIASTQHELKVGITKDIKFNKNNCFSDHSFGWAYYGNGSLRHNSNSQGINYGKKFKNIGVIGVYLNIS